MASAGSEVCEGGPDTMDILDECGSQMQELQGSVGDDRINSGAGWHVGVSLASCCRWTLADSSVALCEIDCYFVGFGLEVLGCSGASDTEAAEHWETMLETKF